MVDGAVIECMDGYIPRVYEAALRKGLRIKEPGKSVKDREKGKISKPRLKHRPDLRKYVKNWNKDVEQVVPGDINPLKNSLVKPCLDILWREFNLSFFEENIVGVFNKEPIFNYLELEKKVSQKCVLRDECPYVQSKNCCCIWLPYQILTWKRKEGNKLVSLKEPISSPWISSFHLRDLCREQVEPAKWIEFRDRVTGKYLDLLPSHGNISVEMLEDIAAAKLVDNLRVFQRTHLDTNNCYGLVLHQCDMAIDNRFDDLETVSIRLTIGRREPQIETYRDAARLLRIQDETVPLRKKKKRKGPSLKLVEPPVIEEDEEILLED